MRKRRIALVAPALANGGGVPGLATFLCHIISTANDYELDLISLATSFRDRASVRLTSPFSWLQGPQVLSEIWHNKPIRHVGAIFSEFEFQRYSSRRLLTQLLNEYDLIQVIAGTPAWGLVAEAVTKPVALFVATLAQLERSAGLAVAKGLRGWWYRCMTGITIRLDYRALRYLDTVFVLNRSMQKHLQSYLDPDRVVFAPPGVDTELFHPAEIRDGKYILSVGRFSDPRKNVRMLFSAYQHLRQNWSANQPIPKLLLVGQSSPTQADWQFACELGLAEQIEIKQAVTPQELAEFYRHAALFVLSSDEEGLGLVILEAMASGLPVVATRCGGPQTAITDADNGFLTRVGDPLEFAKKISDLLVNRSLNEEMGKRARQTAEKQFSLTATGKLFLEKYDQLLSVG
ncbi:MAG: glycosyltransferase [Acidobacteriota bacterium]